jgi:hypothetical protein
MPDSFAIADERSLDLDEAEDVLSIRVAQQRLCWRLSPDHRADRWS